MDNDKCNLFFNNHALMKKIDFIRKLCFVIFDKLSFMQY